jgi:hypothetical protein
MTYTLAPHVTAEMLEKEFGFKRWRVIFLVRKIENDMYVHIAIWGNGNYERSTIQRGNHIGLKGKNEELGDADGYPIQASDIQDLIQKGYVIVNG